MARRRLLVVRSTCPSTSLRKPQRTLIITSMIRWFSQALLVQQDNLCPLDRWLLLIHILLLPPHIIQYFSSFCNLIYFPMAIISSPFTLLSHYLAEIGKNGTKSLANDERQELPNCGMALRRTLHSRPITIRQLIEI
jgi:hypothetical protein